MVDKAPGLGFQISMLWKILRTNGKRTYPFPSSHGSPKKGFYRDCDPLNRCSLWEGN